MGGVEAEEDNFFFFNHVVKRTNMMNFPFYRRKIIWIILCSVLIILLIILIIFRIYFRLRTPQCGGYLNPNERFCDSNNKITTVDCDPIDTVEFDQCLLQFLQYLDRVERSSPDTLFRYFSSRVNSVNRGLFYFAIPELLKILPTAFGQNQYTPYGILSFFNLYPPCISSINSFCNHLFHDKNSSTAQLSCVAFLRYLKSRGPPDCVFSISDRNPAVLIEDNDFFNEIGLLGSFSLDIDQVIVLSVKLPVASLELNYWSFNLYVSDSLDPDAECYPFRQTIVASIAPPFNMYTAAAQSRQINPEFASGFIIIGLNESVVSQTVKMLYDAPFFRRGEHFIRVMQVPAGDASMKIDPDLPNPNGYTTQDAMFNPLYQRLSLFMRVSPRPYSTPSLLHNLIYFDKSSQAEFEVVLLRLPPSEEQLFGPFDLPPIIDPPYNEITNLSSEFSRLSHDMYRTFFSKLFWIHKLECRNSVANLFAPLYHKILRNPNLEYKGGYQAIQMAGNGQGDNYDAQYRASQASCFGNNDILLSLCTNHAYFNNCINNSVNLVDLNRAYGFSSVQLDESTHTPFYIVIFSRDNHLLNLTENTIRSVFSAEQNAQVTIFKNYIRTGVSIQDGFPLCHEALLVERVYLNTNYKSIEHADVVYNLRDLIDTDDDDRWDSLVNVVCPRNNVLIKPLYWRLNYSEDHPQIVLLILIFCFSGLFVVMVILALFDIWRHRQKKFK